ncbi:ANK [Mytilus edulis]|uniref:ANK n=1 Tax=Mytilus edulis TaxID=6550 RepID=A0A8S3TEL3_MYTED|nr:ANK [Mytilus edulis]
MKNVRYIAVFSSILSIVLGAGLEKVDNSLSPVKKQDQTSYMNCSVIDLYDREQSQWNTKTHLTDDPLYISSDGIVRFDLFVEERNRYSVVKYRTHNSQTYQLIIESLTEIEAGNYTCQIYLPNQNYEELPRMLRSVTIQIAPYITTVSAATVTVQEGENVTLVCEAYGYPLPNITWKRGDGSPLPHGGLHLNNGLYRINNVNATDRGLFICSADNNVKPHASYSVQLKVLCAPYCTAIQDTVGQEPDRMYHAILECLVFAQPRAEVIWYKENRTTLINEQILDNDKYTLEQQYDERLRDDEKWYTLKINNVVRSDYRDYYCTALNKLGKNQAKFTLFEPFVYYYNLNYNTIGKAPSTHQVFGYRVSPFAIGGTPDVMVLEKDQVNYSRLIYLLYDVSPKAVRVVFNRGIHPQRLKEHLNKSKIKLQGNKQFISKTQWNLIYPSYGEPDPDSEKFDIKLMVFLLRHLTDIGICDELPLNRDKSEGEAISILKFYRNKYSHTNNGSVAEEVYLNLVNDIVENICVLDPNLKSVCDEFSELCRTDPTLYEQLKKQVMSMMFIRQMSEGNKREDLKNEWKKTLTKFYYSENTKAVEQLVSSNQIILISGLSGSGKSAIAFYIALNLEEKQGYNFTAVSTCADITALINPFQKQVFVLDDVFGISSFDSDRINCWQNCMNNIYDTFVEKTKTKIFFTCRSDIYKSVKERGLEGIISNCSVYEMQDLSLNEKKEMAKLYFPIERLPDDATIEKYKSFPLLCSLRLDQTSQSVPFGEIDLMKESDESSKLRLESLKTVHSNDILSIPVEFEDTFFTRTMSDLKDGMNWDVLGSNQTQIKNYRVKLITQLKNSELSLQKTLKDGSTALHVVAAHGYYNLTQFFLEIEASMIEAVDNTWRTPLHYAASYGKNLIVKLLLKNDSSINAKDYNNVTPLMLSCYNEHMDVSKILLDKDADINCANDYGWSALHIASFKGLIVIVELILKRNCKTLDSKISTGATPLYLACEIGNDVIALTLLQNNAEVNCGTGTGSTPLYIASQKGHIGLVKLLLKFGASVHINTINGFTPLHAAVLAHNTDIVQLLLSHDALVNTVGGERIISLHLACENGDQAMIDFLIKNAAEIETADMFGETALFKACTNGFENIVEYLTSKGASVNQGNKQGRTPLHVSCVGDNKSMCYLLLKKGALINQVDIEGQTPLYETCKMGLESISCRRGQLHIVNYLLEQNCAVYHYDIDGTTPLHKACQNNHKKIVEKLVPLSRLNTRNFDGETALFVACKKKYFDNTDIVKLLCYDSNGYQTDISVNIYNNEGMTPLHIACNSGNADLVELLLKLKANIDLKNTKGETCLLMVCKSGIIHIAKLLIKCNANVNIEDKLKKTPLSVALKSHNANLINLLQRHNAKDYRIQEKEDEVHKA